jgi:hypothetical protein
MLHSNYSIPLLKVLTILYLLLLIPIALAESSNDVSWGGVWLRGSNDEREKDFPIGTEFAFKPGSDSDTRDDSGKNTIFAKELLASIRAEAKLDGGRILDRLMRDGDLASAESGRALVMACAINYEFFETTIEAGTKVVYAEVGFDLLMCDFASKNIVFALPARLQFKDIWEGKVNVESEIRRIYQERLPKEFLRLAKKPWDGGRSFQTLGFGKVDVWDDAKKQMPVRFSAKPEFYISSLFSSTLSKTIDLPVMPYSRGNEAVYTGLLMNNVADVENVSRDGRFILQEPNYVVNLVIPTFKEVKGEGDGVLDTSLHYAFARVTIAGETGLTIFNEKFDAGVRRKMAKGGKVRSLWLASWDATGKLFKKAAQRIASSKKDNVSTLLSSCKLR